MKRFLTRQEWQAWERAGRPPMSGKQLRLACRSVTLAVAVDEGLVDGLAGAAFEESLKSGDKYARKVLGARSREAGVVTLAVAAGEDVDRARIMAADDVDPKLQALWLAQLSGSEPEVSAPTLLAGDRDPNAVRIMATADPELRAMWLSQVASAEATPSAGSAPLGMDNDRYALHVQAKQLAQTKIARDPRLSDADAYTMATLEIEDAKFLGPI